MTKTSNVFSFSALALVGAMFALPVISSDANASATSKMMRCQFNTKQKVVDCCQRVLRSEEKPLWLNDAGGSCSSVAVCGPGKKPGRTAVSFVAAKPKPKCFIRMIPTDIPSKGGDTPAPPQTPRNPRGKD